MNKNKLIGLILFSLLSLFGSLALLERNKKHDSAELSIATQHITITNYVNVSVDQPNTDPMLVWAVAVNWQEDDRNWINVTIVNSQSREGAMQNLIDLIKKEHPGATNWLPIAIQLQK